MKRRKKAGAKPDRKKMAAALKPIAKTTRAKSAKPKAAKAKPAKTSPAKSSIGGKRARSERGKRHDPIRELASFGAQAIGLPIEPAWLDAISFNLRLVLKHAGLVDEFLLDDDSEPAPVFDV